jgi:hypothetical protein
MQESQSALGAQRIQRRKKVKKGKKGRESDMHIRMEAWMPLTCSACPVTVTYKERWREGGKVN